MKRILTAAALTGIALAITAPAQARDIEIDHAAVVLTDTAGDVVGELLDSEEDSGGKKGRAPAAGDRPGARQ